MGPDNPHSTSQRFTSKTCGYLLRWVLTHKHPDLRQAFEEQRRATSGIPPAFQHLHGKIANLEAANRRLRADNTELAERSTPTPRSSAS